MNNSKEYIAYYDSKIKKYKNRIKWLCKIIGHLNDKIDIYEECKSDFIKVPLPTKQKKETKGTTETIGKTTNG